MPPEKRPPRDLRALTDWTQVQDELANRDKAGDGIKVDEQALFDHLQSRVKGQDHVLRDFSRLLWLSAAKVRRDRPIASVLFLGPTGTGKTETAKALAEYLYGSADSMIRFDCTELQGGGVGKTRLIGSPTGYVGADQGGQLTRPVMANPRRVILFDEIEKAAPDVFDLFLQLLGEGRLTEQGSGKVVDYTKCIFVLTSNAHAEEIGRIGSSISDETERRNAIKGYLADAKVFRPEIIGRFDRVYVFNSLEVGVTAEIVLMNIDGIASQYELTLVHVSPALIVELTDRARKSERFGTRALKQQIEDLCAPEFVRALENGWERVRLDYEHDRVTARRSP